MSVEAANELRDVRQAWHTWTETGGTFRMTIRQEVAVLTPTGP
jgi:hypothetical protein